MRVAAVLVGMLCVLTVRPVQADPIDHGDWFVSDYQDFGNGSVIHYDSSGALIESKGGFSEPRGMDVGRDGHLYVGDKGDDVTQFLKSEFQTTAIVVTNGVNGPGALEFGPDRNLFCAAGGFGNIQRFNGPFNSPFWGGQVTFADVTVGGPGGMTFGPGGDLYVSDNGASGVIERYSGLNINTLIGTFVSDSGNFNSVSALAFGPDRNLYVSVNADSEILRYQGPNGASPGTLIDTFIPSGGDLTNPVGIAFGSDGNLYVCQPGSENVVRFQGPLGASPGAFIDVFVNTGAGTVPLFVTQAPVPNPINTNDWFVGDVTEFNGYVYHFNSNGTYIESQKNGFHEPRGLDVGPDGMLYVVENNNRIHQFSDTNFQNVVQVVGSGIGGPFDLEFGPDDNLFLSCRDTADVKRWNGPTNASPFGGETSFAVLSPGRPLGLAFGPNGNLYVADSDTAGVVKRYNGSSGALIGTFISDAANFDDGFDLDFGPDGNLYISDLVNSNIVRYEGPNSGSPGAFIDTFVSTGGSLSQPAGIKFGHDGDLYVCNFPGTKVLCYEGPNSGSPGTFVSDFMELDVGRQPWFLTQAWPTTNSIVSAQPEGTIFLVH